MTSRWTFTSAVIVAALSMAVLPVGAQGRGGNGRERGGGRATASQSAPRQQSAPQAQARQSAPRQQSAPQAQARQASREAPQAQARQAPREAPQAQARQTAPRPSENRQYSAPAPMPRATESRPYSAPQARLRTSETRPLPTAPPARVNEGRSFGAPQAVPRADANRQSSGQQPSASANSRQYNGSRAVPRANGQQGYQGQSARPDGRGGYAQPRNGNRSQGYGAPRPPSYGPSYGARSHYARPYHSQVYVRPYYYAPYRPYHFGHAYYSFRPYWSIGFGLWAGYSVPYPYAYLGTYLPRVYGYDYYSGYGSSSYGYNVAAEVQLYGGVSFDISPSDADLFIDGEYVGRIDTFGPEDEPLTLTPGEHRIAIQRDGYRPMEWDVTIEVGQVIPYRGKMERY
jgi:hypothetical protein